MPSSPHIGPSLCASSKLSNTGRLLGAGMLLLSCLCLFPEPTWAQGQREYIYLNERLIAVESHQGACIFVFDRGSESFPAGGGTGSLTVTTTPDCVWTAQTTNPWITISNGTNRTGTATISYTVGVNSSPNRVGGIAIEDQSITINQSSFPQPTCLTFQPDTGFAGLDPSNIDVCEAPTMTVWVRYQFTPRGGGTPVVLEDLAGTTNPSGVIVRGVLPQNTTPGRTVVTAIRNSLRSDWRELSAPYPEYKVRPAKPITLEITEPASATVILDGSSKETAQNSQNQTVYAQYHRTAPTPPGGDEYFSFVMNQYGWASYAHPCSSGNTSYTFTRVRNLLDNDDDNAWTNVNTSITYTRGATCPDFTVQVSPSSAYVPYPGGPRSFYVSIQPIRGFNASTTLTVAGLPTGASASFSRNPIPTGQNSILTVTMPANMVPGTNYSFNVRGTIQGTAGYLGREKQVSLQLPLQPTGISLPRSSFAGIDNSDLQFSNAPSMTVWVRSLFSPWGGGPVQSYEAVAGTTDSTGKIPRNPVPQNTVPGTSTITAIRNDLRGDWYELSTPYPQSTIRPPKPNGYALTPPIVQLQPAPGTLRTISVGNEQNQTIVQEESDPPNGTTATYSLTMDSSGNLASYLTCGVMPGTYRINKVRNSLDNATDAWLLVNVQQEIRACVP